MLEAGNSKFEYEGLRDCVKEDPRVRAGALAHSPFQIAGRPKPQLQQIGDRLSGTRGRPCGTRGRPCKDCGMHLKITLV